MKSPYFAQLAARILARAPEARILPSASKRSLAVLQIELALRKKAARRKRSRWAAASVALVAAAAGVWITVQRTDTGLAQARVATIVASPIGGGARVLNASGSEPLHNSEALAAGAQLVSAVNGGASLRLSTGTELAVERDANLLFANAGPAEHFVISRGAMLAKVAKLRAGERFVISTPDVEVEVHGTVFRVAVVAPDADCPGNGQTRVDVREGIVEVRANGRSAFVHAGQKWPTGCAAKAASEALPAPKPVDPSPASRVTAPSTAPAVVSAKTIAAQAPSTEASSLVRAQNDLFAEAIAARRRGDSSKALATFQALIMKYPASALAENAAAERMRILAATNHEAAERAAREYLTRYPRGFAARDASTLLTEP